MLIVKSRAGEIYSNPSAPRRTSKPNWWRQHPGRMGGRWKAGCRSGNVRAKSQGPVTVLLHGLSNGSVLSWSAFTRLSCTYFGLGFQIIGSKTDWNAVPKSAPENWVRIFFSPPHPNNPLRNAKRGKPVIGLVKKQVCASSWEDQKVRERERESDLLPISLINESTPAAASSSGFQSSS